MQVAGYMTVNYWCTVFDHLSFVHFGRANKVHNHWDPYTEAVGVQ